MSSGWFRLSYRLLPAVLVAASAPACSLDTHATGAGSVQQPDGGAGAAGASGGAGGGRGGSSGGGGGGTGAVGGAPDGGAAGQENCFDHKDNDENGFVDCGDPACQSAGYNCQKSPPSGWEGYFRTAGDDFNTTAPPPTCPDGSQPVKYRSKPVPASCSQCTCGAMQGTTCGPGHVFCSSSSTDCSGATDWSAQFQGCHQAGTPGHLSCRMQPVPPTSVGTCTPSGGELENHDLWARWLYVCGAPRAHGGGCVPGQSCAASGTGSYAGTVCIRKAGEQSCPSGWSTRLVGYEDGTDTRSCTPCSCTPVASSVKCSYGEYTFYDHSDCTCDWHLICDSSKHVNSFSCVDVSGLLGTPVGGYDWGGKYTKEPAPTAGMCTPSGGQPTGDIQTTGAVTYCCL